jgi:general nucleoside transport system permease protein
MTRKAKSALPAPASLAPIAVAVVIVIVIIYALLVMVGAEPSVAAYSVWHATFGSPRSFGETLIRAIPLLVVAATLVPSLRAGIYNIGAPGQMDMGALAATVVALALPAVSGWLVVPLCALAAGLAGAATGLIPGLLKARLKINEIVPTLAFNFIAVAILGYLLNGPMQSNFANLPQSKALPASSGLPIVLPGTRVHIGLLVSLAAVTVLLIIDRSLIGYRLRLFGANVALAMRAKIDPARYTMWLFLVAGAGAGLAGWMQVTGIDHRLYPTLSAPVGYAGLFVALLGGLGPLGITIASFLLGVLLHGGDALQVGASLSPEIINVMLGLVLFAYAAISNRRSLQVPGETQSG